MSQTPRWSGHDQPWGRIVGLLTACSVTLIGVARGIDPGIILLRAAIAAVLLGLLAALLNYLISRP